GDGLFQEMEGQGGGSEGCREPSDGESRSDRPVRVSVNATVAGQCHRYSPYEMRPIQRRPPSDSSARSGDQAAHRVGCTADAITTATAMAKTSDPPWYRPDPCTRTETHAHNAPPA